MKKKYRKEFPDGTPLVCACEKGRFEDVKLLITGYNDVNGSNGNNNNNMTLKEYASQVGKNSDVADGYTPLMIAAKYEHFQIVKYLIEQGEADPNITNSSNGLNAAALIVPTIIHCQFLHSEFYTFAYVLVVVKYFVIKFFDPYSYVCQILLHDYRQ